MTNVEHQICLLLTSELNFVVAPKQSFFFRLFCGRAENEDLLQEYSATARPTECRDLAALRHRNGLSNISETALVSGITEKHCFLGSAMPMENDQIPFCD